MKSRVGKAALSGSFFLIKDNVREKCSHTRSVSRISIPPHRPPGLWGPSLPSVSPHRQGSFGGRVLPPAPTLSKAPLPSNHSSEMLSVPGYSIQGDSRCTVSVFTCEDWYDLVTCRKKWQYDRKLIYHGTAFLRIQKVDKDMLTNSLLESEWNSERHPFKMLTCLLSHAP